MKLATTTSDFRSLFVQDHDNKRILSILKDVGFRYIDLSFYEDWSPTPLYTDTWEWFIDDLGNHAAREGLTFVQAHSGNSVWEEGEARDWADFRIRREMDACARLGIPCTVVHCNTEKGGNRTDFFRHNGAFYRSLLKHAEGCGVKVLTENTCQKNCKSYHLLRAEDYFELSRAVDDHPLFGICWDIGHAHIEGVNQYKEMTQLGDKIGAVHIHDNDTRGDNHIMPFLGTISMDEIMQALMDMKFSHPFTLEAGSSLRPPVYWQGNRKIFGDGRLAEPPLDVMIKMEETLYTCAKHILSSYGAWEKE